MEVKQFLSITEMARLRGITTETLRYYDRIGLLHPDYLDQNKVRYYSVLKYEQLETIKELQQMGLELKEIAAYLDDRRIDTSCELLLRQQRDCLSKIKLYQTLNEKISRKIALISRLKELPPALMKPEVIKIADRFCLCGDSNLSDELSLGYACMALEQKIKQWDELIPIYASDCYAGRFFLHSRPLQETQLLFLFDQPGAFPSDELSVMPGGSYLRVYSSDSFWKRSEVQACLASYAARHRLHLDDTALVISKVDYSITDLPAERLYEFQVRILP